MSATTEQTSLKRARDLYKSKDRETIARHHGIDVKHPALMVLLAFCVEYGLDPLGGHVWLVDNDFDRAAADGEPVPENTELSVAVTRDGFLTIARRDKSYEGMEHDAVRTKDEFTVRRADGEVTIFHNYPDLPEDGGKDGEDPEDYRGDILGAYAKVYVKGRKPTYYFAWMKEHGQFRLGDNGERIFENSWTYTSIMIIKSAQSVALRLSLGITGVVGIDEIRPDQRAAPADPPGEVFETPAEFIADLELPEALEEELQVKVKEANDSVANSWSLAKLRMRLTASNPEDLEAAARRSIEEIERELKVRAERGEGAAEEDVPPEGGKPPAEASVPAGSAD